MTILNKIKSDYPVIARYTNRCSAEFTSELDLKIAYNNKTIGVHSYRFALGDRGLCVSDYNQSLGGFQMFSFRVIGQALKGKCNIWKKEGGLTWKYNYAIEPTSLITLVSHEDFLKITGIPYKGNGHVFNGHKTHKYKFLGKNKNRPRGQARRKLYRYLAKV
jgi:hypothetical protein